MWWCLEGLLRSMHHISLCFLDFGYYSRFGKNISCVLKILLFASIGRIFLYSQHSHFLDKNLKDSLILELYYSTKRSESFIWFLFIVFFYISYAFISLMIFRFCTKCISLISIHFQLIIYIAFLSETFL